jgi:hypothetical protein
MPDPLSKSKVLAHALRTPGVKVSDFSAIHEAPKMMADPEAAPASYTPMTDAEITRAQWEQPPEGTPYPVQLHPMTDVEQLDYREPGQPPASYSSPAAKTAALLMSLRKSAKLQPMTDEEVANYKEPATEVANAQ